MTTSQARVRTARTLPEALHLRAAHPEATVLAGGTDLMVQIAQGTRDPETVLDLWGCAGLSGVEEEDGGWKVGALTTWSDLARDARLPPVVRECAQTIGARQIQNRGTVGGNIVNASPAGDSLPVWLALDARFEAASSRGSRRVAAADFFLAYRQVDLAPDELLVAVHLPDPGSDALAYRKVGARFAQAISKVVFAGRVRRVEGVVTQARIALGSVAPVPVRARAAEAALVGRPVDPSAAALVARDIAPIDDIRSTADYRRRVAVGVVRRWLETVG